MKIILALLFLFCFNLCQAQYRLPLKIYDVPPKSSVVLELLAYNKNGFEKIDSIQVDSNGMVYFKIPANMPSCVMQITVPKNTNQSEFLYNPKEQMHLEASFWAIKNGDIITENSMDNAAYSQWLELQSQFNNLLESLNQEKKLLTPFQPNYRKAWGNLETRVEMLQQELNNNLDILVQRYPNTYTADVLIPLSKIPIRNHQQMKEFDGYLAFLNQHYFDFVNFNDARMLRHYFFMEKIFHYLTTYTQKTEDGTKRGLDYLLSLMKENEEVNSLVFNNLLQTFIKLDSEVFTLYLIENSKQGCALKLDYADLKKLQTIQALTVGATAPELLLYDDKKNAQSLHSYVKKNKYTVIFVWISWCVHCQKTIPKMNALYEQYKKKGLGVFAVSLDEEESKWKAALASIPTTWLNVSELVPLKQSKIAQTYSVTNTPTIFILDKDGKIVAKNIYNEALENFLKEKLD